MMHYTFGETLTVERIRNQALVYFFPDGVSNMGSVKEYDILGFNIRPGDRQFY